MLFIVAVLAAAVIAVTWSFASQIELTGDDFETLTETTYICTDEVQFECNADSAANQLAFEGEERLIVSYDEIPEVLIQAVIATEDKSFFEHQGFDPVGLSRAAYQTGRRRFTGEGSVQGGSTITQQYIKLIERDAEDNLARKAREVVRAIKLEQQLADELGSKEEAKKLILERYLNRAFFGRRASGVAAASLVYFGKDLSGLTLPEAAFLAGLIRNPNNAEPIENPEEAARRREVTLLLMQNRGFITEDQQIAANNDEWTSLVRETASAEGLGDVAGSDYGSEYFMTIVRRQLAEIFPNDEYFQRSLRVYTTLDQDLQRVAHQTITGRLDPNNSDMPFGSLVTLDDQGRVVALMAGADFDRSQVNLAVSGSGLFDGGSGGTGYEPGSTMKPIVLAEFIEQGFSPSSYYENKPVKYPEWEWNPSGGTRDIPNHRTVAEAMRWSSNSVFAQMIFTVGIEQATDMGRRLGLTSTVQDFPTFVLGGNTTSPLDVASVYSTLKREGVRQDPVFIDRIEDDDGNVLCWYPSEPGDCSGDEPGSGQRQGEQVIGPAIARQVNATLVDVVANGTGKKAQLVDAEGVARPAAGKTGTTNNSRHAWFAGFSCKLTTTVWVGYPGVEGEPPRNMDDDWIVENNVKREEQGLPPRPTMESLFGEGYDDITGGSIPAELWQQFMLQATANDEPCEISTESPSANQRILGQELLTTIGKCVEPSQEYLAQKAQEEAEANGESTSVAEDDAGDGNQGDAGGDENAAGLTGRGEVQNISLPFKEPLFFQGNGNNGNGGNNGNNGNNGNGGNNGGGNGGAVFTPTTEPCLPVDEDGRLLPTTTIDPSAPTTPASSPDSTTDPNATSSTDTTVVTDSTVSSETTLPPASTETTAAEESDTTVAPDPQDDTSGDG